MTEQKGKKRLKIELSVEDVQEALRLWHGGDTAQWPLAHLRLGLQNTFADQMSDIGPMLGNRNILNLGLEQLRTINLEWEEILRQRYEHRQDVAMLATTMNLSRSTIFYRQRQAIVQLVEILNQLEREADTEWLNRMSSRLELSTYNELVGISEPRQKLLDILHDDQEHFIVAIEGLGGLGKTALADYLAREMLQTVRFDEIAWVTARQTHLSTRGRLQIDTSRPEVTFPLLVDQLSQQFDLPDSALTSPLQKQRYVKRFLEQRACLIVIDNLETVADYKALLPELRQWQNPSKFLLTSRLRLIDQPGVYSYALRELEQEAAFQLIRQEARRTGFADLYDANEEELQRIYDTVGGNPLALKLVIGQLRFHSLSRVLSRLAENQTKQGYGLFDYIYREAWDTLDENSQITLLSLAQAGETGFTPEHIMEVTQLSSGTVEQCLEELVLRSLVDIKGSLQEWRYSLHRLTEVFLLNMLEPEGKAALWEV